jgi:pimeloyl-ACP methyl ester carboxylesterase
MERMEKEACADWRGTHLLPGAGHWVQQEQPEQVTEALLAFLRK